MPFGGLLTGGVMALSGLGGLFSNRGGTSKQTQTSNQQQTVDMNNMPQYDSKAQSLRDMLVNMYMDNLQNNDDYFKGYTANGVNEINRTADSSQRQMENLLASRGIRGSMAGTGLTAPVMARQSILSSFMNSIPQLQDQRRQGILQSGSQFLSSLPVGQHNYGTTNSTGSSTGTNTTPSNMFGGLFGNMGTTLAGMYGNGMFDPKPSTSSPNQVSQSMAPAGLNASMNPIQYGPTSNPWTPQYYNPQRGF